ncbi:MAG TPA: hypothetical protein GYA10_03420 [Alphaproteobacteria bacterium]|nr:hypothetical protein [Alphaproteobacteria bacterium]
MSKLQYVDQSNPAPAKPAIHSEFLRTGRIDRNRPNWSAEEKRYLTYEEVAARTGKVLTAAGERTHERLNGFHKSIQFPKLIFHRTLSGTPHLGYCHVTASKSKFAEFEDVRWAFYIANFFADIAPDDLKFEGVNMRAERMYFAVAVERDEERKKLAVNRRIRGNGLLFRTDDPKTALKNVLLLGARHEALRKVIRAL